MINSFGAAPRRFLCRIRVGSIAECNECNGGSGVSSRPPARRCCKGEIGPHLSLRLNAARHGSTRSEHGRDSKRCSLTTKMSRSERKPTIIIKYVKMSIPWYYRCASHVYLFRYIMISCLSYAIRHSAINWGRCGGGFQGHDWPPKGLPWARRESGDILGFKR